MIKRKRSRQDTVPLAINIIKFQRYNFKFFSSEEVIIFEYFTVKAISFKLKEFYHSSATIEKETGIKRSKLETILHRFVDLKILSITVKGMPKVKWFKVHFKEIYNLLPKIYMSEKGKL